MVEELEWEQVVECDSDTLYICKNLHTSGKKKS